jgi:hypothetical protein
MARGWESKAVESQQAEQQAPGSAGLALTPEARSRHQRREATLLALTKTRDELARATRPVHKTMLEQAIAALEAELNAL